MGQPPSLFLRADLPSDERDALPSPSAGWGALQRAADLCHEGLAITSQHSPLHSPLLAYLNSAFLTLLDNASQRILEASGVPVPLDAFPNDSPIWQSLRDSHRTDDAYTDEIEIPETTDGKKTILRIVSEPVRDASGCVSHRIIQIRNVTARASFEETFRCNKRLASIGLLAASIAHEINNPAGSALLAAETALSMLDTPGAKDQIAACLQNIITSMDRCGRIVRTLLRYSREEPTERQACSINDVAKQSLELALPYAERHSVALQFVPNPQVPLAPMNPLEIELVLVNLVRNSVEAGTGTSHACIFIRTDSTDHAVQAIVSDNGRGMTPQQQEHVFDPLYTTRRQEGGSGLGMSIAREIVLGHGGRMKVQSQLGQGTTVTVELPLHATVAQQ